MKFEIKRTSLDPYIHGDVPPCEEAIRESDYVWSIEVGSLEELVSLCSKYGDLIIERYSRTGEVDTIEIYDDYRE